MASRMTIPIFLDGRLLYGDVLSLEVDSVLQADRIRPWGPVRRAMGAGFGLASGIRFGRIIFDVGQVLFGAGDFGVGVGQVDYLTQAAFDAGDYLVRLQADDDLLAPAPGGGTGGGNLSAWSQTVVVRHRPKPDEVDDLVVAGGGSVLSWSV